MVERTGSLRKDDWGRIDLVFSLSNETDDFRINIATWYPNHLRQLPSWGRPLTIPVYFVLLRERDLEQDLIFFHGRSHVMSYDPKITCLSSITVIKLCTRDIVPVGRTGMPTWLQHMDGTNPSLCRALCSRNRPLGSLGFASLLLSVPSVLCQGSVSSLRPWIDPAGLLPTLRVLYS
uniref:Uncharacterized protein n=1 Tax=Vitis vinifera TaxID=29760 RepID=A5AZX1_VITVI|nr:hypothetical protein VITISV_023799 [Vitis vinifera]